MSVSGTVGSEGVRPFCSVVVVRLEPLSVPLPIPCCQPVLSHSYQPMPVQRPGSFTLSALVLRLPPTSFPGRECGWRRGQGLQHSSSSTDKGPWSHSGLALPIPPEDTCPGHRQDVCCPGSGPRAWEEECGPRPLAVSGVIFFQFIPTHSPLLPGSLP